jgi:hypothetical protein
MIFKARFADGGAEIVHASHPSDARFEAVKHFPGRLIIKIERAGLLDMANRRQPPATKSKLTQ